MGRASLGRERELWRDAERDAMPGCQARLRLIELRVLDDRVFATIDNGIALRQIQARLAEARRRLDVAHDGLVSEDVVAAEGRVREKVARDARQAILGPLAVRSGWVVGARVDARGRWVDRAGGARNGVTRVGDERPVRRVRVLRGRVAVPCGSARREHARIAGVADAVVVSIELVWVESRRAVVVLGVPVVAVRVASVVARARVVYLAEPEITLAVAREPSVRTRRVTRVVANPLRELRPREVRPDRMRVAWIVRDFSAEGADCKRVAYDPSRVGCEQRPSRVSLLRMRRARRGQLVDRPERLVPPQGLVVGDLPRPLRIGRPVPARERHRHIEGEQAPIRRSSGDLKRGSRRAELEQRVPRRAWKIRHAVDQVRVDVPPKEHRVQKDQRDVVTYVTNRDLLPRGKTRDGAKSRHAVDGHEPFAGCPGDDLGILSKAARRLRRAIDAVVRGEDQQGCNESPATQNSPIQAQLLETNDGIRGRVLRVVAHGAGGRP